MAPASEPEPIGCGEETLDTSSGKSPEQPLKNYVNMVRALGTHSGLGVEAQAGLVSS